MLLPTFRALACVLTLARFHVHTSETLSLLKEQIYQFGQHVKVPSISDLRLGLHSNTLNQEIRESDTYRYNKRLSFNWPKMHSLTHLVESICRRGVISASSTDRGEALHPQGRKDWSRTNHRDSALKQVSVSSNLNLGPFYMDL